MRVLDSRTSAPDHVMDMMDLISREVANEAMAPAARTAAGKQFAAIVFGMWQQAHNQVVME